MENNYLAPNGKTTLLKNVKVGQKFYMLNKNGTPKFNGNITFEMTSNNGKVFEYFRIENNRVYSGSSLYDQYVVIIDSNEFNKGGLIAPNGKVSNLTPVQYELVRTKAFKDWFGDWENDPSNASKVVDENGEPLVVYHGSNVDFNVFEKSKTNPYAEKQGYFFAFDKKYAESYNSKYVKPFFINIKIKGTFDDDDNLVPFNADGNIVQGLQVEVYDKKNIKLADGTNTTFDSNNNDIRFEQGGNVHIGESIEFYERTYADGTKERFSIEDYEKNIYPLLEKDFSRFVNGGGVGKLNYADGRKFRIRVKQKKG